MRREKSDTVGSESEARYLRAKELFVELRELASEERRSRLAEACGEDAELHRDVEALFAHHDTLADSGAPTLPAHGFRDPTPSSQEADGPSLPERSRFLAGVVLAERYRIVSFLGRGGMGEVYRADDMKLEVPVALKLLPEAAADEEDRRARFLDEVKIARAITHPNVCRVYDVGEADGFAFLTMEYVDGEDLASLLRRIGRLPQERAVTLGREIADGLAAAHDQGILHRDLKPANLMIDGDGRARITDFGLASLAESVRGIEVRSGTPAYMAPEQHAGREVSVRSDLYALGLVLYELTTGRRAFEAGSYEELIRLHRETRPEPPGRLVAELDPALEQVILHCLEKDPRARPASAREVAAALPDGGAQGWRPAPGLELPHRRHWVIERKLGAGGFGEVWLAAHTKTGEQRAFKFCFEVSRLQALKRESTIFRLLKEELGARDDIARIFDRWAVPAVSRSRTPTLLTARRDGRSSSRRRSTPTATAS